MTWLQRVMLAGVVLSLGPIAAGCGGSAMAPGEVKAANLAVRGQAGGPTQQSADPGSTASTTKSKVSNRKSSLPPADSSAIAAGPVGGSGSHSSNIGTGVHAATGSVRRASCSGFKNQTGITNSTVTLANVADISGPVPGIFTSAELATKAYLAYFNATSSLCGRKLDLLSLDSRTDAGADQAAYLKACSNAFAAVGSMSAFDSGGAATAQHCGLPDIRSQAVSDARNACTTCFGAQATELHAFQNAVPDFFLQHYRSATQHAAMIYVNAAASVDNAKNQQKVEEKRGMKFVYSAAFDVAEFNYTPYVERMKDKGVRWIQFVGSSDEAVRLAQAMANANFKPEVFLLDPTAYDPNFVGAGGSAVNGSFVFINFTPFEEAARNPELRLYEQWLQQVSPGAAPSYFGLFSWSAARLFVEQATALGGRLTRANLVSRIRGVHHWTGNGLHAPEDVGGKTNGDCWRFIRLERGHWKAVDGTNYICHGSTRLN